MKYDAIVIGTSAGGLSALSAVLGALPESFHLPVIVVQHRSADNPDLLEQVLSYKVALPVCLAEEKDTIKGGCVYCAPAGYHLLIETDRTFSLSYDPPVNFSRPSIDVLFETAAAAYGPALLAIILTGASRDGAEGIQKVRKSGGTTIAQQPANAQFPYMPQAAVDTGSVQHILDLQGITSFLLAMTIK